MDTVSLLSPVPSVRDVVQVDFPFGDRAEVRRRPALVIATVPVHAEFSLLWLAMITRASGGSWALDVPISDLGAGGLQRPCVVRTGKVASIDSRLVTRVGTLAPSDCQAVAAALRAVLGSVLSL